VCVCVYGKWCIILAKYILMHAVYATMCACVRVCVCACARVCECVCARARVDVLHCMLQYIAAGCAQINHTHTRTHAHTHTHTHTHWYFAGTSAKAKMNLLKTYYLLKRLTQWTPNKRL